MSNERAQLATAVKAATDHTPLIMRCAINATKSSHPISVRRHSLNNAVLHTTALLEKLVAAQTALGWRSTEEVIDLLHEDQRRFLQRFIERGWLAAKRDDPFEQLAVDYALRQKWLRRELSEVHFTPIGRRELAEVHA